MQSQSERSPQSFRRDPECVANPPGGLNSESEEARQIAERLAGDIGVGGVRQMVAASRRQRLEAPVRLDEFEDRNVVGIGVVDHAFLGKGRDRDQWDARAVPE